MASAIYPKYKEALMNASSDVSLTGDSPVKVSLIDSEEITYSSSDIFYSDLNANGVIASATLENVTVTNGVLDADDVVFSAVSDTEDEFESILIWIDTENPSTSRLVAWLDTNVSGLPMTPDGSDITLEWSGSGIFAL